MYAFLRADSVGLNDRYYDYHSLIAQKAFLSNVRSVEV